MNEFTYSLPDLHALNLSSAGLALVVAVLSYLAMHVGLRFGLSRAKKIASGTANKVDDLAVEVIGGTSRLLMLMTACLIGVGMLDMGERWNGQVDQLWFITVAVQLGLWLTRAISLGLRRYEERSDLSGAAQRSASATLMSWFLRSALWAVVLLAVLSNVGVDITAFIASLGVGGIAVALAVQNILGDIFASVSIAVDKPFEVGDFIVFGTVAGTVQHIGVKTTRIRSIDGEQIIVGNTDLLKQVVKNYKRMTARRVVFKFGLTYGTTDEQAKAVPGILKRIVQSNPKLKFDRAHLAALGESSIDFELVYQVQDPDYTLYMDAQQALILQLMREVSALGADFAFPTRTVHLAGADRADRGDADAARDRPGLAAAPGAQAQPSLGPGSLPAES